MVMGMDERPGRGVEGTASGDIARQPTDGRRRTRRLAFRLAGTLLLLVCASIIFGFLAFVGLVHKPGPADVSNAEGIVVLTGGPTRINEAVRLLNEGRAKRLLITGVNPATTDSALLSHLDDSGGLFECCVDLDRRAENTVGNAAEAAVWAREHGFDSLIIVTSDFHMPRSRLEFSRHLPNVSLDAFPIRSESTETWWRSPEMIRTLLFEYAKFLFSGARYLLGGAVDREMEETNPTGADRPFETISGADNQS